MRTANRPLLCLSLAVSLCSTLALAAPPEQMGPGGQGGPGQQQGHGNPQQGQNRPQNGGQQAQPNPQQHQPQQQANRQSNGQGPSRGGQPPADFGAVRQEVYNQRQAIGRGPDVPSHVQIVKGRPMPAGYGRRLPSPVLANLPHYDGYEWRRVGADMVLVALTSGIVYEILANVLN
jgi:hypothetical protein